MKVNREMAVRAGLELLDQVGLEQLTLRLLARELDVQAPTLYWHFQSKQDLLDEMATLLLAEGAPRLLPARTNVPWTAWVTSFGNGLRQTLLSHRDGARMVSGTRLTNLEYMRTMERFGAKLTTSGFAPRAAIVLLSTVYNFTLSFVMEEQAVFPQPGKRSLQYDLETRNARLDPAEFPLSRQAGAVLFERFDRRYTESLALIVSGAAAQ